MAETWHWARISGDGNYGDLLIALKAAGFELHGSVEGTREEHENLMLVPRDNEGEAA